MNGGLGKDLTKKESMEMDGIDVENALGAFSTKVFNNGIIDEVDAEKVRHMLANPEKNQKAIENLAMYYYLSNGDTFQQFDLTRVLPTLNYTIKNIKRKSNTDNNMMMCEGVLRKINHREFTRDLISQVITTGTVCGLWVGEKKDMYPIVFDDIEHFFPSHRKQGKFVVWCDLAYFDNISEMQREIMFENLDPYVTKGDYEKYKKDMFGYRYVELPSERSFVLRTHTLKRNQRLGQPWITQSLFEILHKKKLKDLEKSVSNKIVNAIGVLTIGDTENPNLKMNKNIKKKIYGRVKEGLEKNESNGITLLSLPEFTKLDFGKFDSSPLNPNKFDSINEDTSVATGVSKSLVGGKGGNYATSKLNLDIMYRKIGELLEIVENEVYSKLFDLILPKSCNGEYYVEYDKGMPLSQKERADVYMKLHTMGYSLKPLVEIAELNYHELIEDTMYEIEQLKLREKVLPPQTSYTLSGDENGRPEVENSNSENTNSSKDTGSNEVPRAGI